jgi:GAF domain-containing protein
MTAPSPPEEALIALAGILVFEQSLEKTLRQILELAVAALSDADEGGIILLEAGGPRTVIATSDTALRVDSSQYDAVSGGPGLQAYRQQQILRIKSTASDSRWPEFATSADAAGLASTLSVPLLVGGDGLGALNIYSRRRNGFTAADERLAVNLGSCASVVLANARVALRAASLADQLQAALACRGAIDQATGILMVQRGFSSEEALHLMAAVAQRNRLSMADVASDLVRRTRAGGPSR